MNRFLKFPQAALWLLVLVALSGCTLGQAAASPTPEPVDVNAVMTSAASTAFVELTAFAKQATATPTSTPVPSATPTLAATETPAAPAQPGSTATTDPALEATATTDPALLLPPTAVAGGLPATATLAVMAGTPAPAPSFTPRAPAAPGNTGPTCFNSQFVADVTIPDGTVLQPYQKFYKVWRIQNTGTCTWDQGFGFVQYTGPNMGTTSTYFSNNDQPVRSGGIVDIGVEMRAPTQPGEYIAHWVMVDDSGKTFGGDFVVAIKVVK